MRDFATYKDEELEMAIHGLYKQYDPMHIPGRIRGAVAASVTMLRLLEQLEGHQFIRDERLFTNSLIADFSALDAVANGRTYLELPAAVHTETLVQLAANLAVGCGYRDFAVFRNYWGSRRRDVPLTAPEALKNGIAEDFIPRLAPYSSFRATPLLHCINTPVHALFNERAMVVQALKQLRLPPDTPARTATHRDFLVWYSMDCIRKAPPSILPVVGGRMWIAQAGLKTLQGTVVGAYCATDNDGRGVLGYSSPRLSGAVVGGIGLSIGL